MLKAPARHGAPRPPLIWCPLDQQVTGPGEPAGDFVISGPADHGVRGLVSLFGIESPGLTASMAIADVVTQTLLEEQSPVTATRPEARAGVS